MPRIRFLQVLLPLSLVAFVLYHFDIHLQLASVVQDYNLQVRIPALLQKAVTELQEQAPVVDSVAQTPKVAKPFTRHIVAVGDLHGDYPNAQKVLQFSGVVDEYGNWTGNVDFFVQTGDIIDR